MTAAPVVVPLFVSLGHLPDGGQASAALAVSADGQVVVGVSDSAIGLEPFRWTASTGLLPLTSRSGDRRYGIAYGVSHDGSIAVGFWQLDGRREAFRWSHSDGVVLLGYLPGGGANSVACGVNDHGLVIAGESDSDRSSIAEPFLWRSSTKQMEAPGELAGGPIRGAICRLTPDGKLGIGSGYSAMGHEAMLWREGAPPEALGDLPGGTFESYATGLSADGTIVVGASASGAGTEAFHWSPWRGMVGLGDLPGGAFVSAANGVSGDGWVVVGDSNNTFRFDKTTAFLWDPVRGMRDLKAVMESVYGLDLTGWRLTSAHDISADGTAVVGQGINPAGVVEAYLVRIPPFCYADCDDSTGHRVLDLNDFLEFQRRFALQDLYSDCDQNGAHDLFDFLCFQNAFAAGCP